MDVSLPFSPSNAVYLQALSNQDLYVKSNIVYLDLESVIIYSVYKYCSSSDIKVVLVFSENSVSYDKRNSFKITLSNECVCVRVEALEKLSEKAIFCTFPVAEWGCTVITGMCAVARHICKHRQGVYDPTEHDEGLLGFRQSCLQAPNETSIWTKFCEIDLIKTTKEILNGEHDDSIPVDVFRFENHLKKPVKVHNVYKLARECLKQKNTLANEPIESLLDKLNIENTKYNTTASHKEERKDRQGKNRKWKSSIRNATISSSTPIGDLNVTHKYAEGPFITLADIILYPCFYLISQYYDQHFATALPATAMWLINLTERVKCVTDIMESFLQNNNISKTIETEMKTIAISDVSLYKCDQKRHNPKKRLYTKESDVEIALASLTAGMELPVVPNNISALDWDNVPPGANPKAGHLPDKRMDRKCEQLENLALNAVKLAKDGDFIVDFCSGSGHLGILVAHLLPKCRVLLLENKEQSLSRARVRVEEMGLTNVYFFQCNIDFFIGKFDIGLALHACGIATDLVLEKCLKARAKFVMSPCCYGSLHSTDRLKYPQSLRFSSVSLDKYMCIAHAADQTHIDHPLAERGARCMAVIDSDRARLAEERGYRVVLTQLKPLTCTPKNNLLIGVPCVDK